MRIVLATPAAEAGGVWKHVHDLALGYQQRGHDVALAIPADASPALRDVARRDGFPVVGLGASASVKADVWHLHLPKTLEWKALAWTAEAALVRGRATVLTEHLPRHPATDATLTYGPHAVLARPRPGAVQGKTLLKKLMLAPVDRIVAVSQHSRSFLASRYGISPHRIAVVPNGVAAPAHVVPLPDPDGTLRVVGVGALHWRKGFDVLLDAVAQSSRSWSVTLVGDGTERAALEARAGQLGSSSLRVTGWLADAATAAADAHVLCLPSRAEAMPYAVLEAMACGRAVVATAVDGVPEVVEDGRTGMLVAPDDPAALTVALEKLDSNRDLLAGMGDAGRQRHLAGFTLDHMVDATLAVYESA